MRLEKAGTSKDEKLSAFEANEKKLEATITKLQMAKKQRVDASNSDSGDKQVDVQDIANGVEELKSSMMRIQEQQVQMQQVQMQCNSKFQDGHQQLQHQQQYPQQQQQKHMYQQQKVMNSMYPFAGNQPALVQQQQQQNLLGPILGQIAISQHAQGQGSINGCQVLSNGGNSGMFANSTNMAVSHQLPQSSFVNPTQNTMNMGGFM